MLIRGRADAGLLNFSKRLFITVTGYFPAIRPARGTFGAEGSGRTSADLLRARSASNISRVSLCEFCDGGTFYGF